MFDVFPPVVAICSRNAGRQVDKKESTLGRRCNVPRAVGSVVEPTLTGVGCFRHNAGHKHKLPANS